ncbi:MAG TPA: sigma factor-like helix-turn-helix DNA-binding protein [Anaerolineae bacterium]
MRRIIRMSQEPVSLEAPLDTEANTVLGDVIADDAADGPMDVVSKRVLKEQLRGSMDSLSEPEREVIVLRFGLRNGEEHAHEEIAERFGVGRTRIRQIEDDALRKLRNPQRSGPLRDFLE